MREISKYNQPKGEKSNSDRDQPTPTREYARREHRRHNTSTNAHLSANMNKNAHKNTLPGHPNVEQLMKMINANNTMMASIMNTVKPN